MQTKIKFLGDLSIQDAKILVEYGSKSKKILEFGVGGSTQIFSQCKPELLVSVETSQYWIDITKTRLSKLTDIVSPVFVNYDEHPKDKYDLIFVDGVDDLRKEFAINTWELLNVNGVMIFHDTRRFADFSNATWVAQLHWNEITKIDVNFNDSNMTIIHKKEHQPYVNWQEAENKPAWAYGATPLDNEELWTLQD